MPNPKKTLTRTILLQIITEQEDDGEPLFTTEALSHIIRFYGDSVQSVAGDYIQRSIDLFVTQQKQLQEQLQSAVSTNPMTAMSELSRAKPRNVENNAGKASLKRPTNTPFY